MIIFVKNSKIYIDIYYNYDTILIFSSNGDVSFQNVKIYSKYQQQLFYCFHGEIILRNISINFQQINENFSNYMLFLEEGKIKILNCLIKLKKIINS